MSMVYPDIVPIVEDSCDTPQRSLKQRLAAYVALTKPRIMLLILFTAYCSLTLADGYIPGLSQTVVLAVGLGLSSGGAAAINMWYDRDIDQVMKRTSARPIPAGLVPAWHALVLGVVMGLLSVAVLAEFANWCAAWLALGGYVYYAVFYTMILKRRTPQNIVVGGGAGAFPPLVGWAVATGSLSWAAFVLFAVIFLWTPAHFWALALYKNEDYTRAGIPMMPVVRGARATKHRMVGYTLALILASVLLPTVSSLDWRYAAVVGVIGLVFLMFTIRTLREPDHEFVWAKKTFFASLLYLPIAFGALLVSAW